MLISNKSALFNQLLPYFSPRISVAFRYDEGWSKQTSPQSVSVFRGEIQSDQSSELRPVRPIRIQRWNAQEHQIAGWLVHRSRALFGHDAGSSGRRHYRPCHCFRYPGHREIVSWFQYGDRYQRWHG